MGSGGPCTDIQIIRTCFGLSDGQFPDAPAVLSGDILFDAGDGTIYFFTDNYHMISLLVLTDPAKTYVHSLCGVGGPGISA